MKNKSLGTYHSEGLYDISHSMESGLIYLHTSNRKCNKNSAFPFLVLLAIFCHPLEGKACHEITVGLHSITDGRIKPCCLGGWCMAALTELNVSFLSSYLIQRGLWIFLSCRRDQEAKESGSLYALTPALV